MSTQKEILLLTDYRGVFGSKYSAVPYRSGYDHTLLKKYFTELGYKLNIKSISEVDFRKYNYKDQYVIYNSIEEDGGYYKSYIEDIILALKCAGAKLIPPYEYLRAHHNKTFMELMRDLLSDNSLKNINSKHFGSLEELLRRIDTISLPVVVKQPDSASSRGVHLAKTRGELITAVKKVSNTKMPIRWKLKEKGREKKHSGYVPESNYRKKFIVQQFIPGLKEDWKILAYGKRYYMVQRPVYKDGFKSSGGDKKNMHFTHDSTYPEGIYDFAKKVFEAFNAPAISIDVCFDGAQFYLIEFQFLNFGTSGHAYSTGSMQQIDGKWQLVEEKTDLEFVFAEAVDEYIKRRYEKN